MQNEPNLPENQVNASFVLAKGYEAGIVFWPENPKANLLDAQMNVNLYITRDYGNKRNWALGENKPKTNPIQTRLIFTQKWCIFTKKGCIFTKKCKKIRKNHKECPQDALRQEKTQYDIRNTHACPERSRRDELPIAI
jgi:hypothetical protein